jgi:hypothetical protein
MNPLHIAQVIVAHIAKHASTQTLLSDLSENIFVQRVPPNTNLPYLQLLMRQSKSESYPNRTSDTAFQMQMTLVCSLSNGAETLSFMHDAINDLLDQKQLVLQHQTQHKLMQCWIDQIKDIDIEHDRIKLISDWQLRSV